MKTLINQLEDMEIWVSLLLAILAVAVGGPVTVPFAPDGDINKVVPDYLGVRPGKAFHLLSSNMSFPIPSESIKIDIRSSASCDLDLNLEWSLPADAPVYAAPIIFPSYALNDRKNIFVSTFREYIDLIDGDGKRPNGWPISFPNMRFFSSPVVFDIDGDGHNDIGVVDEDGGLYFVRVGEFGEYLDDYHIQLPPLRVRRDWVNLTANGDEFVMVSMFDQMLNGDGNPDVKGKRSAVLRGCMSLIVSILRKEETSR